ncbi:mechanosensitive ion channel family protein [bacterium]|nr:mechanosensitive ion channel family protein [bacterium]
MFGWLTAISIAIGVFLIIYISKVIVLRKLSKSTPETEKDWGDLMFALTGKIKSPVLFVLALYSGTLTLDLPTDVTRIFSNVAFVVVLLQVALIGTHIIGFYTLRYRQKKITSNAAAVTTVVSVGFVLKALLWFVMVLVALDNFGVNVNTLVTGLGIGGIAVALAVQNLLGDLFASFSIVLDKPFVIGDFIIVGEYLGTVEHVGLKTTRIRSLSGEQLIFSNGDLLASRIRNFKSMVERRVLFSIGVIYQTTYDQLVAIPEIIRSIIESQSQVRFDRAHFKEYGAYSLNFEIVYWIQHPDYNMYMDIQQTINLAIYRQFDEMGIAFAFPTRTLFIEPDKKSNPDGDGA